MRIRRRGGPYKILSARRDLKSDTGVCRPGSWYSPHKLDSTVQVISENFLEVFVLPVGQDEGGAGYLGDPAGACGDVLEGAPAAGEQGEAAFALAAQPALEEVAGELVLV